METITQHGCNLADIVIIAVLILGFIIGRNKGIVGMALRVVYGIASFGASLIFYPVVSGIIRQTPMFGIMKEKIVTTLGLETAVQVYTKQQEVNMITALRLPQPLKEKLLENNNSVIYELVGADSFVDYIAGFVANLVINVVLVWILFLIFLLLLRIFLKGLELIAKMPVLGGINHLGGAIMGLIFSTIIIWLGFTLVYAFIAKPAVFELYQYIASSKVAVWFYEHNLLLDLILKRLF